MKSPLGEDKEPVEIAVAKRGRPAKNAVIYDDDRNMIITEAEHEEINQLVDMVRCVDKNDSLYQKIGYQRTA